ncbi:oxidoreductase family, NAD-binding rossmann fold domain-containing protein [Ditylenchus destructor]|uniref:Trans-1,2-dihydrobenzene-1,2-diol dehydrogenase n=1 Tax=Ditylenchus destructor TaxID=166010 RepID=A0AAD4MK61_9BILA|nr:oxidoreductase family, NAD-binding rossmann fold domain-containing protein [Ditylenchus destructor]
MSTCTERPLRWGILGCGLISGDFVRAMNSCRHANEVHGVAAADSLERAIIFRDKHFTDEHKKRLVKCHGSYEELLARNDIDVVYIGVANHVHKSAVVQALNAKKHVLCEKPFAVNAREVREMIEAARRNQRFLMEAYWSRFFPVFEHMRHEALESIGGAQVVTCDFGINVERVKNTPLEQGGGYLLANGCYAVMFAQFAFGGERPKEIVATGNLDDKGIDIWANVVLKYSNDRIATVFYHGLQVTPCQASISGTKGYLKLPEFFWCPSKLEIKRQSDQTANSTTLEFPLPKTEHTFFYPNSVGLCYETDHMYECLRDGKSEITALT